MRPREKVPGRACPAARALPRQARRRGRRYDARARQRAEWRLQFLLDEPTAILMPTCRSFLRSASRAGCGIDPLLQRLPKQPRLALTECVAPYPRPQGHAPILPEGLCRARRESFERRRSAVAHRHRRGSRLRYRTAGRPDPAVRAHLCRNASKTAFHAAAWTRAVSVSTPSRSKIAASKSRRFIVTVDSTSISSLRVGRSRFLGRKSHLRFQARTTIMGQCASRRMSFRVAARGASHLLSRRGR